MQSKSDSSKKEVFMHIDPCPFIPIYLAVLYLAYFEMPPSDLTRMALPSTCKLVLLVRALRKIKIKKCWDKFNPKLHNHSLQVFISWRWQISFGPLSVPLGEERKIPIASAMLRRLHFWPRGNKLSRIIDELTAPCLFCRKVEKESESKQASKEEKVTVAAKKSNTLKWGDKRDRLMYLQDRLAYVQGFWFCLLWHW